MKRTFSTIAGVGFGLALCLPLCASTINVSPGAGTLQTAINGATAGDTLVLADGSYTQDTVDVDKALTIQAQNLSQAVITSTGGLSGLGGVQINADGVVLEGLTVQNCDFAGVALYAAGTTTLTSMTITGNGAVSDGHGIQVYQVFGTLNLNTSDCDVDSNGGRGASCGGWGDTILNWTDVGSSFDNNLQGVFCDSAVTFDWTGSSVSGNTNEGVQSFWPLSGTFASVSFDSNGLGAANDWEAQGVDLLPGTGSSMNLAFTNCTFNGNQNRAILLEAAGGTDSQPVSTISLTNCEVDNTVAGGEALGMFLPVDFTMTGGQIMNNDIAAFKRAVTSPTSAGLSSSLIFDGVTISGNLGTGIEVDGGGEEISTTIQNCTISNNAGVGAIRIFGRWGSSPTASSATLTDNWIDIGAAGAFDAAVHFLHEIAVTMDGNIIEGEDRKGILAVSTDGGGPDMVLNYNTIVGDFASTSFDCAGMFMRLENSVQDVTAEVNNTIFAGSNSGIVAQDFGSPGSGDIIKSGDYSLYYTNGGWPMDNTGVYSMGAAANDIEGQDPLFVDAAGGDYTPGSGSPAVGASSDGTTIGAIQPPWAGIADWELYEVY
ncbi:right-handed parallel beta-helix repeat-containing protein [bacterium]|nr:right-handed parallel beta-helix repeat-containing protein [bacterium]